MYVINTGKYTYIEEYNYFGNVIKLIINDMSQLIDCLEGLGKEKMVGDLILRKYQFKRKFNNKTSQ